MNKVSRIGKVDLRKGVLFKKSISIRSDGLEETKTLYKFVQDVDKDDTTMVNVTRIDNQCLGTNNYKLETRNGEMVYELEIESEHYRQDKIDLKTKEHVIQHIDYNPHSHYMTYKFEQEKGNESFADLFDSICGDLYTNSINPYGFTKQSLLYEVTNDNYEGFLRGCGYTGQDKETGWFGIKKYPDAIEESHYKNRWDKLRKAYLDEQEDEKKKRDEAIKKALVYITPKYRKEQSDKAIKYYKDKIKQLKKLRWSEKVVIK